MKKSRFPVIMLLLVLLFFYLPILVLTVNSFNASRFGGSWDGFTLRWYQLLLKDRQIWAALKNTLLIASGATLASCILGTSAAMALNRWWRSRLQHFHYGLIYTPLVVPDILMGISLLLTFTAVGIQCGMMTILLAHITFCISFVTMTVLSRLQDFDHALVEAARDLGATPLEAFFKVQLPLLMPGVISGGLLAFTLSVDDFVITFFVAGPGSSTLPLKVYSMIKHSPRMPIINCLSTIMLFLTFLLVLASRTLQNIKSIKTQPGV
jgi:spermidine/putrescine transport system permease protein